MNIFLSAFEDIPDPRAENARHDLRELLVVAFVSVLCGATSCAEMAAFGRAKENVFRGFLRLCLESGGNSPATCTGRFDMRLIMRRGQGALVRSVCRGFASRRSCAW
ncbi:MAG: transposase family protein [Roseovarius sp.]